MKTQRSRAEVEQIKTLITESSTFHKCFIEDWNEENPKSKLHPGFIDLLKFYIRLAYIAGWDDHRILVDEILNRPGNSSKDGKISKHFFKALLEDLQNRV